jgi:sporulation protein YtfJ
MKTAMETIKDMVDVNTVVGNPVETQDGQTIIPISRVAFGFAAGGGEYGVERHTVGVPATGAPTEFPFGGGSGAGVSVQPMGFLVVGQNGVRMLPVDGGQPIERIIDMAPQLIEKIRNAVTNQNGNDQSPGLVADPSDIQ